ncbi:MAG: hypothetical protein KJS91_12330, partial [Planctomycetes bacterium]|nr:hypothetical protein [Planctomycetota bacterium]
GVVDGATYYVVKTGDRTFKLASSLANAEASPATTLTAGIDSGGSVGTTATIVWAKTRLWLARTQADATIATAKAKGALSGGFTEMSAQPLNFDGKYLGKLTREAISNASNTAEASSIDATANSIGFSSAAPFSTGDRITYINTNMASDAGAIPGLVIGGAYFVIRDSSTSIRLAATREGAFSGQAIDITGDPANRYGHTFLLGAGGQGSITGYDSSTNSVITGGGHGFVTGDTVTLNLQSGIALPGSLLANMPYKAVVDSQNKIAFVSELADIGSVNTADSTIGTPQGINVVPFDQLTYTRSGVGSDISGLASGTTYLAVPKRGESGTTSLWLANTSPIAVSSAASSLFSSTAHGLADGDRVVYRGTADGTGNIPELGVGTVYIAVRIDADSFSLKATSSASVIAISGTSVAGQRFHKIANPGAFTPSDSSRHTLSTPRIAVTDPSKTIGSGLASTDQLTFAVAHGLNTFDSILLTKTGSGNDPAGLVTDKTYLVIKDDSTRLRLADAAASIKAQVVNVDSDTIMYSSNDTAPSNGLAFAYRRADNGLASQSDIGGLASGTVYYIINLNATARTFQLAATLGGPAINLTSTGAGNHLFVPIADITADFISGGGTTYQLSSRIEVKGQQSKGASTIAEANKATEQLLFSSAHGLSTGQRVYYEAVSGRPIEGLVNGQFYFVIRDSDTAVRLAKSKADATASPGVAIDLKSDGRTGTHRLNLTADPIVGIELAPTSMSGSSHTLVASTGGITISSESVGSTQSVNAENRKKILGNALAKSPLGMAAKAAGGRASGAIRSLLGLENKQSKSGTDKYTAKTGEQKANVTGSLAIQVANIKVDTIIRQTAVLQSRGEITITSNLRNRDRMTTRAIASVSDDPNQAGAKTTVTVALAVGVYNYSSRVLVERGATVDASGTLKIEAMTKSPFMIPGPNASETEKQEFEEDNKRDTAGDDLFGSLANTVLAKTGLGYLQLNDWTQASGAPAGELAISGAIQVQTYDFNTQAILGWQDPAKTYSSAVVTKVNKNPAYNSPGQQVIVRADTLSRHTRLAGVFNLQLNPNLEFSKNSARKMVQASPTGAESKKGGAGGVVAVITGNNNTEALVGASVDMVTSSRLVVESVTRVFDMVLAGAGAKAGKFGFSGTAVYTQFNNNTRANIASGMTYSGGSVLLNSRDMTVVIAMAGSLIRGSSQGFGVSLAINDLTRNTEASIGERNGTTATSSMTIAGPLDVFARNEGALVGAAIAAAVMSKEAPSTPGGGAGAAGNPSSGGQGVGGSGGQGGAGAQSAASGQSGIGISGAVVLNGYGDFSSPAGVSDNARAFVRTQGAISATGSVTLEAINNMTVAGLSGSAAVNTDPTKSNTGIAGALSINTLGGKTEAYLGQVQLTAPSLGMISSGTGIIVSLAAGVATAPGTDKGTAVSGSVSANNSTMNTLADIGEGAALSLSGNATLASTTNSLIVSVAGAVSYGGKKGIGAAIAVNKVKDTTRASVSGSTINFSAGGLSLSATSDNPGDGRARIVSLAGAVGLSTGGNSASGLLAVNQIENTTEAYISASTLGGLTGSSTGTGISLTAYDDSTIISIGAAIAVGKDTSGGAGIGYADIRNTTRSYLSGVTI